MQFLSVIDKKKGKKEGKVEVKNNNVKLILPAI